MFSKTPLTYYNRLEWLRDWMRGRAQPPKKNYDEFEKSRAARLNKIIYEDSFQWQQSLQTRDSTVGLQLDTNLSRPNTMVVRDDKTNTVYIVHSGTDLQRRPVEDLATDAAIVGNKVQMSLRYKMAEDVTRRVQEQYESSRIVHAGYSLGGALALHLGHQFGHESYSFNPGVSPFAAVDAFNDGPMRFPNQQRIFVTETDWISVSGAFAYPDAERHTPILPDNPHSIDNYLNDKPIYSAIT